MLFTYVIVSLTLTSGAARLAVVPQSPTLPKGFRLFKIRQSKRQNWYAQAVVTEDGDAIEAGADLLDVSILRLALCPQRSLNSADDD
jgi:hypothetical protein